MRHAEDGPAVVAWLQGRVEVGAPPARLHADTYLDQLNTEMRAKRLLQRKQKR